MLVSSAVKRCIRLASFSERLISMGAQGTVLLTLALILLTPYIDAMQTLSPGKYTYTWPRPGLTVDTCVIAPAQDSVGGPSVLLIQVRYQAYVHTKPM